MNRVRQGGAVDALGRVRNVHCIGIGGAGMCGIAEVLHNLGYCVSGSDLHADETTAYLRAQGIKIYTGHDARQVEGCDVVVHSSAITPANVELSAAHAQGIPVVPRAAMLAELMRFRYGVAVAGTHGKTTTTSLIVSLMADGGLDPTYVIGGILNRTGSSARLGSGPYLIAEADESDRSFLLLTPLMALLTNIDADHLEAYDKDLQKLRGAFLDFVHRLPFYGLVIWCADDPALRALAPELARPAYSYGFSAEAHYRGRLLETRNGCSRFTLDFPEEGAAPMEMELHMPGRHNLSNALGAAALVHQLGVAPEQIRDGLAKFQGVSRRCQLCGRLAVAGREVLLIDDYAHHPCELEATLEAVREGWPGERVAAVFQPHRYTRTQALQGEFVDALGHFDALALLDIYAAGEPPLAGVTGKTLYDALCARAPDARLWYLPDPYAVSARLQELVDGCGVLLLLGAGSIRRLADVLLEDCGIPEVAA